MSDIDTIVVDSLKALDPEWPIREADIDVRCSEVTQRASFYRKRLESCSSCYLR